MQHKADYYQMMNQKNPSAVVGVGKEDQKIPGEFHQTKKVDTKK